jgi:hypothetical protein
LFFGLRAMLRDDVRKRARAVRYTRARATNALGTVASRERTVGSEVGQTFASMRVRGSCYWRDRYAMA